MSPVCESPTKEGLLEKIASSEKSQFSNEPFGKNLDQKGEATLFCVLVLVALSGLLTLSAMELQRSFSLLKKRTHLFLCTKEVKEELNLHVRYMGRLNWLIKNTTRAQVLAAFIPPLWPHIGNADKLKKVAKTLQALEAGIFKIKLGKMASKGCPLDPRIYLGPYVPGTDYGFKRTSEGAAQLRMKEWTYYFLNQPYCLSLKVNAMGSERLMPKIIYQAEEKGAMLSSLLSLR